MCDGQPFFFSVNFMVFAIKFLLGVIFYDSILNVMAIFIDLFKHKLPLFIPLSHIYQESFTIDSVSFSSQSNYIKNIMFRENNFFDNLKYFIFYATNNRKENEDLEKIFEFILFCLLVVLPFYCLHHYWNNLMDKKRVILDYNFKFLVELISYNSFYLFL